jgi:hypothetical protein
MGYWAEIKDIWDDIKQDKIMKQIGRAILFVGLIALVISVTFYCVDWSRGRHAKLLWGLAENDARPAAVYIHDTTTTTKYDTLRVPIYVNYSASRKNNEPTKSGSKFDLSRSAFSGNTQIGDSNTQNNIISSTDYIPLSTRNDDLLKRNLANLLKKYPNHPTVYVCNEAARPQYQVAIDLANYLSSVNLGKYLRDASQYDIYNAADISFNEKNTAFVNDLLIALRPFIHAKFNLETAQTDDIVIFILGTPSYDQNGVITLK